MEEVDSGWSEVEYGQNLPPTPSFAYYTSLTIIFHFALYLFHFFHSLLPLHKHQISVTPPPPILSLLYSIFLHLLIHFFHSFHLSTNTFFHLLHLSNCILFPLPTSCLLNTNFSLLHIDTTYSFTHDPLLPLTSLP